MLRSVFIFGGVLGGLTSCSLLTTQRDPNEPLPPNWDISQDQPALRQTVVAVVVPPAAPLAAPPTKPNPSRDSDLAASIPVPEDSEETWIDLNHWATAQGLAPAERLSLPPLKLAITNGYQWQGFDLMARLALNPLPMFSLHTTNGVLLLQSESHLAYWDDVEIHLAHTPELVQGEMLVHRQDVRHTIEPLLHVPPALPATHRTIVIDPSFDEDTPAVPGNLRGKNFALDWAERLVPLLATNGWTVFVTHTNPSPFSPAEEAACADGRHPDLFLRLSFGMLEKGKPHAGLATYCLAPARLPADGGVPDADECWHTFRNNAFDEKNLEYAFRLHHVLNDVPDLDDRGVRRSHSLAILRDRNCPAVCISGGSLMDPHDAALIASPWFRQELAEAITSALR